MIRLLDMSEYPIKMPCSNCGVGDLTVNTWLQVEYPKAEGLSLFLCDRCAKILGERLMGTRPS